MEQQNEIVLYQPDELTKLEVRVENETVWLTQAQMAELFQRAPQNITMHIRNIYAEGELSTESTCKDFLQVQKEGNREVKRCVRVYNLDVIISVGYRVKSQRGTAFRIWANGIIKSDLVKSATKSIVLIDNYIDESVFTLLDKRAQDVCATIYTQAISKTTQLDIDKHNAQYRPIEVKQTKNIHDRFLIIDDTVYHIGASIKDLGKKLFAFSKMEMKKEVILLAN